MRQKRREQREKGRADRRVRAEQEAEALRQLRRIKQREPQTSWEDAMRRVGWFFPHASLHRKLRRLEENGVEGLMDQRRPPPSPLTPQIRGFFEGVALAQPDVHIDDLVEAVRERFGVSFARRTLQEVLHDAKINRPLFRFSSEVQPPRPGLSSRGQGLVRKRRVRGSGLIWATIGDEQIGYTKGLAELIEQVAAKLPEPGPVPDAERELRDEKGRFLPAYNAVRPRRDPNVGAVFESVELKRPDKDLGRLSTLKARPETLQKKLRAAMALPVVTDNGRPTSATDVRGCSLSGLGWLDYMPETIAKFLRDLKWAGTAEPLMQRHASFWRGEMAAVTQQPDVSAGILYLDAHVKALYTRQFQQSGRVASVGRVMPCIEQVLLHQGAGVPLYMASFSGHVPLIRHVLPLIADLEELVGDGRIGRLTVLDGEMDCVGLFKQFDATEPRRYFITPLDASRLPDPAAIQGLRHLVSYRDGDWIGGGWLDLRDSNEPDAAPYRCRVIVLERRTKQNWCLFGTNAALEQYTDTFLLDAYFSRWPHQELIFRQLNQATAFKTVHGYGKQRVINVSVIDCLTQIDAQLERLQARAEKAQSACEEAFGQLHREVVEQRRLERLVENSRQTQNWLKNAGMAHTKPYTRARIQEVERRRALAAQKPRTKLARQKQTAADRKLEDIESAKRRKQAERQKQRNRTEIYQNDVELDQIVSISKLGFALILRVVFAQFFQGLKMDINTFINQILRLDGVHILTDTTLTIQFEAHRRNPEMMKALEIACTRFNRLAHYHDGRLLRLEVMWPPGTAPPSHAC